MLAALTIVTVLVYCVDDDVIRIHDRQGHTCSGGTGDLGCNSRAANDPRTLVITPCKSESTIGHLLGGTGPWG